MEQVSKRTVFLIGGYERKTAEAFFERLARQLRLSAKLWNVAFSKSKMRHDAERHLAVMRIDAAYDGRTVETNFAVCDFDDLVREDNERPFLNRLGAYWIGFADFVLSGTLSRFFKTNWRFALYFLYPAVMLSAFLVAGGVTGGIIAGFDFPASQIAGLLAGAAVTIGLGVTAGRRYFVFHLLDLWSYSSEYIHRVRPDMDGRLDEWADVIVHTIAAGDSDEVLLIGHSTGGVMTLDLAARVATTTEARGAEPKFRILTVGSTALKAGFHPKGAWFRKRVAALADYPDVFWLDCQAKTDIINFHHCDPFALMGLDHDRDDPFPVVRQVRFRHMLDPKFYKGMRFNPFRVHYQFISANTQRYWYDFMMICFGATPLPVTSGAKDPVGFDGQSQTEARTP